MSGKWRKQRMPAGEIRPGMRLGDQLVVSATRDREWVDFVLREMNGAEHTPTIRAIAPMDVMVPVTEETVSVKLPGPSPRELACTCWQSQERGELAGVQPPLHAADCPVAPVPGRHGGMRERPAPFRGNAWWWSEKTQQWCCEGIDVIRAAVVANQFVAYGADVADALLQCFYQPPEPQSERREPTPWDPWAGYYDEAVTHG